MSNHLGIARRVARVARAIFWMRNESIRRLRGGGGLLFALPPREEKTRGFGRVANEARGKTRENCAEMCVLRAKTHIVRAVLEWTRSYAAGARCGLSRRGFSKTGFESAFSTTHTRRPRFFSRRRDNRCDAFYQYIYSRLLLVHFSTTETRAHNTQ